MGTTIHSRLLGADSIMPERGVHGRPSQSEPRWAPWARLVLTLDVEPRVGAIGYAGARLALSVLARLRDRNLEQRGRAVAPGGLELF